MRMKRLTMMLSLALGVAAASGAQAQVMLEKAVVASGGGAAMGSNAMIGYTIGQPVVGRATNGTTVGEFGFWSASTSAPASVDDVLGAGAVTAATVSPNPASAKAELRLVLSRRGQVDVMLYDVNGRAVAMLYSGDHAEGAFTLPVDLAGIASGRYYVAVSVPGAIVQRPLTVVR